MAESGGVIRVKGSDGTVKEVTLYTEISDVTDVYKEFKYNGATVYACTTTDPNDELATEFRYLDTGGVTRYLCERQGAEPKSGTVVINGDLTTDLTVDGNIQVSGDISGNAVATGTITYGSLSGTAKQGATVESPCLTVSDGTLTFAATLTKSDGALYTTGRVTNARGTTTVVNCDLTVETSSQHALYNDYGTLTIAKGVTVIAEATEGSVRGVYNSGSSFTVSGTLNASGTSSGLYNSGTNSTFIITEGATVTAEATGGGGSGVHNDYGTIAVFGTLNVTSENVGVHNDFGGTITVSGTLNVTGVGQGVYNYSSGSSPQFIIETGGVATVEATGSAGRAVHNSSSICTVSGTLNAAGNRYGMDSDYSTITVSGTLNVTGGVNGMENEYGTMTVSGTLNATGETDGLGNYGCTATIKSTATAVFTGGRYAVYNTGTYTVESGAKVTYNGATDGV